MWEEMTELITSGMSCRDVCRHFMLARDIDPDVFGDQVPYEIRACGVFITSGREKIEFLRHMVDHQEINNRLISAK